MKVRISLGRTVREYAEVIVEADSVGAAELYVEQVLGSEETHGSREYLDVVNASSWRDGDVTETSVIDSEPCEDDDEEVDVVVPKGETS